MADVPATEPVTTPLVELAIVALPLLLLHVPLPPSVNVVVDPAQTLNVPAIADGVAFTVMMTEVIQPVGSV